jgi:hypothetical protein
MVAHGEPRLAKVRGSSMTGSRPYRLGALRHDQWVPHQYPGLWAIEQTTGPERLLLAPAGGYVELLEQLVTSMEEPYGLLHVLLASRCDRESGRYQHAEPMDTAEIRRFLRSYADYLEHDGRHHTWFFGQNDGQQVIYDNHDLLYCYGDITRFRQIAEDSGLTAGTAAIPAPHEHRYNPQFDGAEQRLFREYEWLHFPLEAVDDP